MKKKCHKKETNLSVLSDSLKRTAPYRQKTDILERHLGVAVVDFVLLKSVHI